MKKHDEGYALVLVLVVVLVLNIAAVGLMTLTLNNLKTQRNLVDRMVNKYAAQGEIEIKVAEMDANLAAEDRYEVNIGSAGENPSQAAVNTWLEERLHDDFEIVERTIDGETFTYVISLKSSDSEKVTIACKLAISGKVKGIDGEPLQFEIEYLGYQYASYEYSVQETSPSETTEGGATE